MRATALIIATGLAAIVPAMASAELLLPSGEEAQRLPVVWDEGESVIRLRFIVERLREPQSLYAGDPQRVLDDMHWLCETQLAGLFEADMDPRDDGWTGVVVTLMDREVDFGTVDTESFQLFEWFVIGMDGCELDLGDHYE
ncbi:DUF6497 family protein [Natronohydrobacter thiooxidans]|uniref:DUF6497 family protein n=1 Tax=Natronohydrobacter thiooxidans TaxID=87172 RepID=UPI000A46950D|nr:DUF6497 family protein [Natronohydrobacter thiooxidans]